MNLQRYEDKTTSGGRTSAHIRSGGTLFNPMNCDFPEVAHQLPRVVASHLDAGTSVGKRGAAPHPIDLRGIS